MANTEIYVWTKNLKAKGAQVSFATMREAFCESSFSSTAQRVFALQWNKRVLDF